MPDRRRYARTPDTVAMLSVCVTAGVVQIGTGGYPGTVLALVSEGWAAGWAWSLVIASLLCLVGAVVKDDLDGWTLELSGRIALAPTAGAYAVALWTGSESRTGSALVIGFAAAVALASLVRIVQLTWRLGRWFNAMSQVGHPSRWRVVLRHIRGGSGAR